MPNLSSQHYARIGRHLGAAPAVIATAVTVADRITATAPDRAVILTLRHLSALSGVPYRLLRDWVGRRGAEPYREFFLAKKPDGRRTAKPATRARRRIAAPAPALLRQQRWLVARVLHHAPRHPSSMAFHKGADLVEAARLHCGCRWLIKMDVRNFFESIHERTVFKVFIELGYPRLLAFELTRLCTRVIPVERPKRDDRRYAVFDARRGPAFYSRVRDRPDAYGAYALSAADRSIEYRARALGSPRIPLPLGCLPQGAPTSPLLANLAMRHLDERLTAFALGRDLVYTRYADDIAISSSSLAFTREDAADVVGLVVRELERAGLRPHHAKTRLVSPGARKIVLGLAVDGSAPRLTREYRNKLRLHAHMLGTRLIAPSAHARALNFRSVLAMRRHIEGKIAHAHRVEPAFANRVTAKLANVDWTL